MTRSANISKLKVGNSKDEVVGFGVSSGGKELAKKSGKSKG